MEDNKHLTTPESAKKIMGNNFISLEETLKIFPCPRDDLVGYELIPYSRELLFNLSSNEENPFILFPAIQRSNYRSLTINALRSRFDKNSGMFIPATMLDNLKTSMSLSHSVCLPRWYLISKKAIPFREAKKFFINSDVSGNIKLTSKGMEHEKAWFVDKAVVYIYAWLLFRLVRKEMAFADQFVLCEDTYLGRRGGKIYLKFSKNQIKFCNWSPHDDHPMVAPVIKPYTE